MYDKLRIAHIFPAQKTTENDTIVKELFRSTKKKKKKEKLNHTMELIFLIFLVKLFLN